METNPRSRRLENVVYIINSKFYLKFPDLRFLPIISQVVIILCFMLLKKVITHNIFLAI